MDRKPETNPLVPPGWAPKCPGCRYDVSGIPDGACPECGGGFRYAALLAEARAAAAAKAARPLPTMTVADVKRAAAMTFWGMVFGVPLYLLCIGVMSMTIAGGELGNGHHWSDTPCWFPWPQATPVPTVRGSLAGGRLSIGIGCILAIGAVCLWRIFHRPDRAVDARVPRPYSSDEPPSCARLGATSPGRIAMPAASHIRPYTDDPAAHPDP